MVLSSMKNEALKAAEEVARQAAAEKAAQKIAAEGIPPEAENNGSATSYDDFLKRIEDEECFVPVGDNLYEIQPLDLHDWIIMTGTPFIRLISRVQDTDAEFSDDMSQDEVTERVAEVLTRDPAELCSDPDFIQIMRTTVCIGVVSLNFVDKPKGECSKFRKELPVNKLRLSELMAIFTAITNLSLSESEVDEARKFREENQSEP